MADDVEGVAPQGEGAASWVTDQWRQADGVLNIERRDYWFNTSFYEGDQWVYWSPANEVATWPAPNGRLQATVNKIRPNVTTNHARLLKRKLVFEVPAKEADDATVGSARLGEHILEACRKQAHWEDTRRVNLLNEDLGGTSAVVVEWDPQKGDELGVDPETGEVVYGGDVCITPLSIAEFTLEPGSMRAQDARWMIICKAHTPHQVKEMFGLSKTPAADGRTGVGPLQRRLTSSRTGLSNAKLTLVYTYYERPSGQSDGRHMVVVNGEVVRDEPWPYPFEHLPVYVFRQVAMPKRWTGTTNLNDARKLQVQLNMAFSQIMETLKNAGAAKLFIPDQAGVDADDITDAPGQILYYDGTSSGPPAYVSGAPIPPSYFEHLQRLEDKIDDIMFVHGISRGQAPGDRNSGLALSVLAEKDETPLGIVAQDQAEGWGAIGSMVLKLYEAYVTETRKSVVQSFPGAPPLSQTWTGKMLQGQTDVHVPLDAVMPSSRAAQQAWVTQLATQFPMLPQFQDPVMLSRLLDLPNSDEFAQTIDADVSKAEMENHLLSANEPILPESFDDHAKHIAEHNRFRKSRKYVYADAAVKKLIDNHVLAHMQLASEEAANQAQLEAKAPGLSQVPQDNEPPGSLVPPDKVEQNPGSGGMAPPNPNAFGQAIPGPQPMAENAPPPQPPAAM